MTMGSIEDLTELICKIRRHKGTHGQPISRCVPRLSVLSKLFFTDLKLTALLCYFKCLLYGFRVNINCALYSVKCIHSTVQCILYIPVEKGYVRSASKYSHHPPREVPSVYNHLRSLPCTSAY